jgi:hypothetical protein
MKAQTLPEVIRAFDPMHPLVGQELKEWYIDRPGNPLERMKIYYTFPIGLRYSAADFNHIRDHFTETFVLPNLQVASRDGSPNQVGLEHLSRTLLARMAEQLCSRDAHEKLIRASGGLMRTLIRLTQRAAVNAIAAGNDAISAQDAEAAINEERADFIAGLRREDNPVLRERHHDKQLSGDEAVLYLLQTRALLEYNGAPWCDVHPIALSLVLERATQHALRQCAAVFPLVRVPSRWQVRGRGRRQYASPRRPSLDYHSLHRQKASRRRDRMETRLTFKYDRAADILYIDKTPPYPEQETEELGDDVVARLNPVTDEIENLEVLFFSTRLLRHDLFELPVVADLRLAT